MTTRAMALGSEPADLEQADHAPVEPVPVEPAAVGHAATEAGALLPEAVERVLAHHQRYLELLAIAEAHAAGRRGEEALRAAQQAAGWAWFQHAGVHASPRLEAVVAGLTPSGVRWRPRPSRRPAVLHVLSQAYQTGGHTRWSDRIIRADPGRTHSVLLTSQGQGPVPAWLRASVEASGGRLVVLPAGTSTARVREVARAAAGFDLVVANLHPNDAAGVAALADPRIRPPVATLNHADHTFWLGMGAADLLVDFRGTGQELAVRRRGADRDRSAVLPLPVEIPALAARDDPRRARIREAMGIGPDEVVLLTAGSAWKLDPQGLLGTPSFPEVLAPLVAEDPRLRLFALGPRPDGPWAAAARLTGARMQALGTRTDYGDFTLATDLYLDTFPMGSLYSLLEPAALGVPGVSLAQWPQDAAVLMVDAPGLDGIRPIARDRAAYEALVRGLVADPAARGELGGRLRDAIGAAHAGSGWLEAWDAIVGQAATARDAVLSTPPRLDPALDTPATDLLARGLAWIPERVAPPPERVTVHLPFAAASGRTPSPG